MKAVRYFAGVPLMPETAAWCDAKAQFICDALDKAEAKAMKTLGKQGLTMWMAALLVARDQINRIRNK